MLEIFKTINNTVERLEEVEQGCWINLVDPTRDELDFVVEKTEVDMDFLKAALDEEETTRSETENGQTLVLVDIPIIAPPDDNSMYTTIPLGMITMKHYFITVCLEDDIFLEDFKNNRVKEFYTQFKTRFILQVLYRNATKYLQYLRQIAKTSTRLEEVMFRAQTNQSLIELLRLEKSLVYFSTSLRANGTLLERMMRNPNIKNYPEDADLLEDVIVENRQAIEMSKIYSSILQSSTEAFASIISNNQNSVMKILTSVSLVVVVPQIIASLYGMNVTLPFAQHPDAFWILMVITLLICIVMVIILNKKDMF